MVNKILLEITSKDTFNAEKYRIEKVNVNNSSIEVHQNSENKNSAIDHIVNINTYSQFSSPNNNIKKEIKNENKGKKNLNQKGIYIINRNLFVDKYKKKVVANIKKYNNIMLANNNIKLQSTEETYVRNITKLTGMPFLSESRWKLRV